MNVLKDSPVRLFFAYAFPAVLGMLAVSSAGIVDGVFVGQYVGSDALAAVNINMPVFAFSIGISFMFAIGGSVTAGKLIGEGRWDMASGVFTRIVLAMLILSLGISALGIAFTDDIVQLLGADDTLVGLSAEYLSVIMWFLPVGMLSAVVVYFVRIDNRPTFAGGIYLTGAIINIFLDWLLIKEMGMGLQGAAIATGLSQLASVILALVHFLSKRAMLKWTLQHGSWKDVKSAAFNGSSDFANEASAGVTVILFNWVMMDAFGVDGVAAFAVINYLLFAGLIVSFAIGDSIQPLVSKNLGAKLDRRIIHIVFLAMGFVFVMGAIVVAIFVVSAGNFDGVVYSRIFSRCQRDCRNLY